MKVLLDHNVPAKMRTVLIGHQAFTAREMGWDRLKNGDLLKAAELNSFDALLTADQSIFCQQNNAHRIVAHVVLTTNDWEILRWHIDSIDNALLLSRTGSFKLVRVPRTSSGFAEVE